MTEGCNCKDKEPKTTHKEPLPKRKVKEVKDAIVKPKKAFRDRTTAKKVKGWKEWLIGE